MATVTRQMKSFSKIDLRRQLVKEGRFDFMGAGVFTERMSQKEKSVRQ
jgi:hypothetical protein